MLLDGSREPGTHAVLWDGRDANGVALGSGLYFVRLETAQTTRAKRMLLLK